MAFFCLGQLLNGKVEINNFQTVNTSFSKFLATMKKLLTLLLTLFLYSSIYATEKLVQTQVQEVNIHQQWQRLHQQVVVLYK